MLDFKGFPKIEKQIEANKVMMQQVRKWNKQKLLLGIFYAMYFMKKVNINPARNDQDKVAASSQWGKIDFIWSGGSIYNIIEECAWVWDPKTEREGRCLSSSKISLTVFMKVSCQVPTAFSTVCFWTRQTSKNLLRNFKVAQ